MMRGAGGAIAMAVAALLVCYCSADSHQEQDGNVGDHGSADQYIANGHKSGNQEAQGGNLVREVRETRHYGGLVPYLVRRYDYPGLGGKRDMWPVASQSEYSGYYGDGLPKRNFDEIDRSGLDRFVHKRNFDEIDLTSMPFPYATKRFYHPYGPNYLDMPVSSFDKKRLFRPDYPMDEIDLSHFPIGSKRSLDSFPLVPRAQL